MYAIDEERILILGGYNDKDERVKSVFCYNSQKDSLTRLKDLKKAESFSYNQIVLISDRLYLLGSDNKLIQYDIN